MRKRFNPGPPIFLILQKSEITRKAEMSVQIVKDGTTDGSKDSFGSGTESSQEFGFYK